MSIERFKLIGTQISKPIDEPINKFLQESNNEFMGAGAQCSIQRSEKVGIIRYASREDINNQWLENGRGAFTSARYATYIHIKEISDVNLQGLENKVNEFLAQDDVQLLGAEYNETPVARNMIITYASISEMNAKQEELKAEQEALAQEMAAKFAESGVKKADVTDEETNEAIDKYAEVNLDDIQTSVESAPEVTAGLAQVQGEVVDGVETTVTTASLDFDEATTITSDKEDAKIESKNGKKNKFFNKNK